MLQRVGLAERLAGLDQLESIPDQEYSVISHRFVWDDLFRNNGYEASSGTFEDLTEKSSLYFILTVFLNCPITSYIRNL
ncbi:hypothetical protein GIB67_008776 [Kingdonia uniflora]|uniref:Uncharacterized protein n=1 Tax=Kingdonia uniflora TaxID=39325 RepID=A0A7J7P5M0_9MAGN|nr:hypothetical protein GIB67_008776 [Kingdonia uniflora]